MGESYRIRTVVGKDKELKVNLEQDYEFLEILSFKIRQDELYLRDCSDYGVIIGRVFANNGFGIPNAKINVFIPLTEEDATNPIISTLYPYKDITTLNEDGYRYNLLPYVPSYPGHAATGTFPDRKDVLINDVVSEIYEKYYKYTVRTNESGDFMIFGVPTGSYKLFMDLDLSDIGEFSLTPQDLIRMGRGTKEQFDGINFKTSSDLGTLPQIVSLTNEVYVSPLWGENDVCQIGITRSDFDLTSDAGIEIRPTSVFMGSMFSTIQKHRVKRNCKVKKDSGELGSLITGPGEIVAIRQTIFKDSNDRPVLEQAPLPDNGKLIDDSGTWMFDVPMNMDYVTTNEFGEQIISNDPSVGIPTTGRYRFKIKWAQSKNINEEFRRAYYLVPNLREYDTSPQDLQNSYAFDLDWTGYTIQSDPNAVQDFIDCKDKFFKFEYSKVYTVSSFIDNLKRQRNRNKFLAIKEISDPRSDSENLKFPINDGVFNPNFLTFVFNLLILITLPLMGALIIIFNILALIWPVLKFLLNFVIGIIISIVWAVCQAINLFKRRSRRLKCPKPGFDTLKGNPFKDIRLPMISYPDCDLCDKNTEPQTTDEPQSQKAQENRAAGSGFLPQLGNSFIYGGEYGPKDNRKNWGDDPTQVAISGLLAGIGARRCQQGSQGSEIIDGFQDCDRVFTYNLPLAEKINLLNTRDMYYRGFTNVRVHIEPTKNPTGPSTSKYHEDNLMVLMVSDGNLETFPSGQIITFVDNQFSKDPNVTGATYLNSAGTNSITGASVTIPNSITIEYGRQNNKFLSNNVTYNLETSGKVVNDIYTFPCDIEYFQVVTAMTVANYMSLSDNSFANEQSRRQGLNGILRGFKYRIFQTGEGNQRLFSGVDWTPFTNAALRQALQGGVGAGSSVLPFYPEGFGRDINPNLWNFADIHLLEYFPWSTYPSFKGQVLVFIQRGVDPKSPRYDTEFDIGNFFDRPIDGIKVRGNYKINVPIQKEVSGKMPCAQMKTGIFSNNNSVDSSSGQYSFFKSHFYQPGTSADFSGFSTNAIRFYSHLDRDNINYKVGQLCPCQDIDAGSEPILSQITTQTSRSVHSQNVSKSTRPFLEYGEEICWSSNVNTLKGKNNMEDYSFYPLTLTSYNCPYPFPCAPSSPGQWNYTKAGGAGIFDFWRGIRGNPVTGSQNLAQLDGGSYAFTSYWTDKEDGCNYGIFMNNYSIYVSPFYDSGNTINIVKASTPSDTRIVLRSDRLPTSSNFKNDEGELVFEDEGNNKYMWQQNMNLAVLTIDDEGADNVAGYFNSDPASMGDAPEYDQGQMNTLLESFNCDKLVGLKCYDIDKDGKVTINCGKNEDYVKEGAYIFVQKPVAGLFRDFENLAEWVSRIRITFALCQGVLSEVFNNNWINGTLFMYPFQQTLIYNNQNKISRSRHCSNYVYRHNPTNTFYYRSTPYNRIQKFNIQQLWNTNGSNEAQIMNPTTIMNLGPKSPLLQFTSTSGKFLGYYSNLLPQTSHSDTSELINVFALSRMLNNTFLQNLFGGKKGGVRDMFSRPGQRVDGDYAQLASINSQYGIVKFDEDDYSVSFGGAAVDPIRLFSGKGVDPLIGVFFSAETYNLQETDYVSPGRIVYRTQNPSPSCKNVSVDYGFETQLTPHYKWKIKPNNQDSIFGSQENNWMTKNSEIEELLYQEMDREETYYFKSEAASSNVTDIYDRNYIWNIDPTTLGYNSKTFPNMNSEIVVGAPMHFYFGLKNGNTALDRYFKDYLNIEFDE